MKDGEMIARLREIRLLRERRADEIVLTQQTAVTSAGAAAQAASDAVALFVEQAIAKERETLGLLVGKSVSAAALHRVQSRTQKTTLETARLRADQEMASAALAERQAELSRARGIQVQRRKAVMKLDGFIEDAERLSANRRVALDELAAEDDQGPTHRASMR